MQGWLSPQRISPRQREALLSLLDSPEPTSAREQARELGLSAEFPVHATLIALLSHLEMTEEEATGHWHGIFLRREELTWRLGRDPGTRVAALDYLVNEERLISCPKIVDESALEQAERVAEADGLTGLPNERTFRKAIRGEIRRAGRKVQEFAIALLDVEGFRRINSEHGRAAGDGVLREVAALIRARLRDMDLAARLGGAHFGLLLPLTRRTGAHVAIERIRSAGKDAFLRAGSAGPAIALMLSGGLAAYPDDGDAPQRLLECAAESLALARVRGGDQVTIHHREQRSCVRLRPMGAPVKFLAQRQDSSSVGLVRVRDISRSGALLEGAVSLGPGEEVHLRLVGDSGEREAPLEARVIREEAVFADEGGAFRAGVRFFHTSPAAEGFLEHLLEILWRQSVE